MAKTLLSSTLSGTMVYSDSALTWGNVTIALDSSIASGELTLIYVYFQFVIAWARHT